ncbi:hypothetical protein MMC07_002743 [Pseudocyphellaria aurata]|nr:hypothetical protein [Pseudocyphellaria aurata]
MPSLWLWILCASSLLIETVVSVPQGTAEGILVSAPAQSLGGPADTATATCGGCFVVAEVLGIVWYSEVFAYNAATAYVSVGSGNTTGRTTRVSVVENTERFTIRPGATGTDSSLALTPVAYDSTATVQGVVVSSPTAYNVFTAYAVNSETSVGGSCSTRNGDTTTLTIAYSEAITNSPGIVTLGVDGEQNFISDFLGLSSCQGQGAAVVPGALVPVEYLTPTVSLTRTFQSGLTLAPKSTPYSSAQPGSSALTSVLSTITASVNATAIPELAGSSATSASEAASEASATSASETGSKSGLGSSSRYTTSGTTTTTTYPFASAPVIIIGSSTITPNGNLGLPIYNVTSLASGTSKVVVVVPTGTGAGAGNYTATVIPYQSEASSWRRDHFWTSLWAATLSGVVLAMVLL